MMFNNLIKIRNKKKIPLLWSFICMLLCSSLLIGSTYAWFTSSVSSNGNRIQAGTLKVGLTYKTFVLKDSEPTETDTAWTEAADNAEIFKEALYQPGSVSVTFFKVENKGSLALKYQLALLKNAEIAGINVLGDSFMLSDYLTFDFVLLTETTDIKKSEVLANTAAFTRENALKMIGGETTVGRQSIRFPYTTEHIMKTDVGSTTDIIALVVTMPSDAGMAAMYDDTAANGRPDLKLDFKLGATQYSDETDAFGSDYDSAAIYAEGWSQSKYIKGQTELRYYGDVDGHTGVPLVTVKAPAGDTTRYTMIVSESNVPVGIAIESGKRYQSYNITLLDSHGKPVSGDKVYEVTMYVGKYLDNIVLYHNGTPSHLDAAVTFEAADYNPATGYLRFTTTKFSAFTVVGQGAVVRMGDQVFKTIESAFEAVHTGTEKTAVITVMAKETEVTSALTVKAGENITLDLNGCTVKADVRNTIRNEGVFTLQDTSSNGKGSLTITGETRDSQSSFLVNKKELHLNSGFIQMDVGLNSTSGFAGLSSLSGTVDIKGGQLDVHFNNHKAEQSMEAILTNGDTFNMSGGMIAATTNTGVAHAIYSYGSRLMMTGGALKAVAATGNSQAIVLAGTSAGSISGIDIAADAKEGAAYGLNVNSAADIKVDQIHIQAVSDNGSAYGIRKENNSGKLDIGTASERKSTITAEGKTAVYGVYHTCVAGTYTHQNMDIVCSSREDIATGLCEYGVSTGSNKAVVTVKNINIRMTSPSANTKYQKGIVFSGGCTTPMEAGLSDVTVTSQNMASVGIDYGTTKSVLTMGDNISVKVNYLGLFVHGSDATALCEGQNIVINANADAARTDEGACGVWQNNGHLVLKGTELMGGKYGIYTIGSGSAELQTCKVTAKCTNNTATGVYNNSTKNIVMKSGNTITATSKVNQTAYALLDESGQLGKIVDAADQAIDNVSAATTCTWTSAVTAQP